MRAFPLISIVSLAFVPQFALADLIPFLNSDSLISVTQSRDAFGNLGLVAQNAAGGLTTVDGTFGSLAAGALVTAQASAIASYGTFGVLSSNTVDVTGVPANVQVTANAGFQDIVTISFAPFTGDPGILYISYTVNGTIANSGVDNSFTQLSVQLGPATGSLNQFYGTTLSSSTSGTFAIPQEFTFIYGQPFAMNFELFAQSGSAVALPGGDTYDYFSGLGSASDNFLDTVTLSGLTPLDPTGQTVVTGAQFSSESGTQYGLTGIVPEPSFIGLMVPLLLIAVYIHRRNRQLRLL
jgi:hypothetical protein